MYLDYLVLIEASITDGEVKTEIHSLIEECEEAKRIEYENKLQHVTKNFENSLIYCLSE